MYSIQLFNMYVYVININTCFVCIVLGVMYQTIS